MGGNCTQCGASTGMLRRLCKACKTLIESDTALYVWAARKILAREGPTSDQWKQLQGWLATSTIDADAADAATRNDITGWLHRYVAFAAADDVITDDELDTFHAALEALRTPADVAQPLRLHMQRTRGLGDIRAGKLPTVTAGIHLPIDELCCLHVAVTRWRELAAGPQPVPGSLTVTNRKVRFVAPQHAGEVALSKVQRVSRVSVDTIAIEATTKSVSGRYTVGDAEWAATVLDSALRLDRRTLISPTGGSTRHIPQPVKQEVWQRDGGKCVQCGAQDYLEFDHVIPFSRGGASTVDNLQLLCRRCNLAKGDRI